MYRDGNLETLPIHKLVLDDILLLKNGDQVPADAKVIEGSLEVNESLLTGEMDSISKEPDAELFSGSFVTAVRHFAKSSTSAKKIILKNQ